MLCFKLKTRFAALLYRLCLWPHLKVLAVNALAVVATVDACLEALAVFLQAARLLAVAALVVPGCSRHEAFLLYQLCTSV